MRKAVLKRIKFTKGGKLLRRRARQNHFNAKAKRSTQLRAKKMSGFATGFAKRMRAYGVTSYS